LENSSTNHGGAAKIVYGETIFVDCDMFENQSFEGGGVYWFGGPDVPALVIDGCSIQGNIAIKEGGGIKARVGYPGVALSDSIVCENLPDQIDGSAEDLGGNCLADLCLDSDADGTIDCFDACPDDPNKIDPGACGCGNPETDANGDGVPDCVVGSIDSGLVWSSQQGGNGHLYSQVSFNTGVTWAEARAYAISLGANLTSFDNDAESIAVKTYLVEQDVSRGWIGLYQDLAAPDYAEPAGGWRWSDGTEYAYVDWLPGEPSDASIVG
ncbi:MAG: C-type lectin domain-containing protein, partial [Phycisphaera sp.]|nr:C-type lectin domain-containing protein [Phycisphaera sp.]